MAQELGVQGKDPAQQQLLGQTLHFQINMIPGTTDLVDKLTGMLLEWDDTAIIGLLLDKGELKRQVNTDLD